MNNLESNMAKPNLPDIELSSDIYDLVESNHLRQEDFIDGDLGERIEAYDKYELVEINLADVNLDEWLVDQELVGEYVDEMKNESDVPICIISDSNSIIDGIHRLNMFKVLNYENVWVYQGLTQD